MSSTRPCAYALVLCCLQYSLQYWRRGLRITPVPADHGLFPGIREPAVSVHAWEGDLFRSGDAAIWSKESK
jgi:hypothetical protein